MSKKSLAGMSLIETLLALGIMVLVLTAIISSFLAVLVSSAKTRILKEIEEDGKYAQRVIEQKIRYASDIMKNTDGQTCTDGMQYINLRYPGGSKVEIGCVDGAIVYKNNNQINNSTDGAGRLTTPKVVVTACEFNCTPGGFEEPDKVNFSYTLQQAEISTRVEEQIEMNFRSTVVLRNF